MILVVCALAAELRAYEPGPNVHVLAAGVGPVEAAIATAKALATGRFEAVVSAGIAGAFRGCGDVGDAVVVRAETLAHFGREDGSPLGLPDGAAIVAGVRADATLVARCTAAGLRAVRGLTVAQVTTSDATAASLAERYGVDVESMEGFAVLRAAADAGIPGVEVRGISNIVGDRARGHWNFDAGARATGRALATAVAAITNGELP